MSYLAYNFCFSFKLNVIYYHSYVFVINVLIVSNKGDWEQKGIDYYYSVVNLFQIFEIIKVKYC